MQRLLLLIPTTTYRAEAFVRAARKLNIDVTVASERPNALSGQNPDQFATLDFSNSKACAAAIKEFAKDHPIDAVVPVDDGATMAASAIGAALGLPHNPLQFTSQPGTYSSTRMFCFASSSFDSLGPSKMPAILRKA